MPPRQTARAGLGLVGAAGYEWQDEKVSELDRVFGADNVHVNPKKRGNRPEGLDIEEVLPKLKPFQFIVEGQYDADTPAFKEGVGIGELHDLEGVPLGVGEAFPDVVQVLPPMAARPAWEEEAYGSGPARTAQQVLPSGDVRPLTEDDGRLRLRVVDIKQSAEPGAHYFAEVVYYSITLASWLVEHGWDDRFVVVAAPAVWPGSYEASEIVRATERCRKEGREPSAEELAAALEEDIEVAPFDVFAPRLGRFFREDLPYVLGTPWHELPWHVSYVCQGCEFLGYPWLDKDGKPTNDEKHCWPEAERTGNLSRVAGLSKGGAKLLGPVAADVGALAEVPASDRTFDASPTLRSKRTVYPNRAGSLRRGETGIIPDSGSDALMPKWPDLHVYLFLDYDLSSAITASFSLRAFWREPLPYKEPGDPSREEPKRRRWRARDEEGKPTGFQEVFLVDRREPEREKEELLKFLRALRDILGYVQRQDEEDVAEGRRGDPSKPGSLKRSTYQIYLWDEAQRKQLVRVVGRHLPAILGDKNLRDLAWLFPPPELLAHAEEASHRSPFTLVSDVVQNTVAVPVPHHYTLLEVAKTYRLRPDNPAPNVHPLYREPLTDLIPGERLHEMWTHKGNWMETARTVEETTGKKLSALANVVAKLERDLKDVLQRSAAPPVVKVPSSIRGVPPHGKLLYEYTRLNAAMDDLDSQTTRAMPPHEREAKFKSAHLLRRLEGEEKEAAHARLSAAARGPLPAAEELVIYRLSSESREFNVRPPALGYALAPRGWPGFLGSHAYPLIKDIEGNFFANRSVAEVGFTQVSVVAIDRVHDLVALKPWWNYQVPVLEEAGVLDLREDVMLDPVNSDFLSKKVRVTLEGIGRPASAWHDEFVLTALGMAAPDPGSEAPESPASEFLWEAKRLSEEAGERNLSEARGALESAGVRLNDSQWDAWEAALTRRLALVWGPPGTGKSQTLRATVAAAVWLADRDGTPLRLLISSSTYAAVDNVLLGADRLLERMLPHKPYRLFRLRSDYANLPAEMAEHSDVEPLAVKTSRAPQEVLDLQGQLEDPHGIVVVAGPSQQLHNLAIATKNKRKKETPKQTQRRWFDLVVVDEASQMDVAESVLVVSKAADGAAFVLAGDDKQLPPIHKATPPENLDDAVGSLYGYVRHHHGVAYLPLQVNYRANSTLVDFTKRAGYDPGLHARHPGLRLAFLGGGPPAERPADWPESLHWTPEWRRFLDPNKPAVSFVYEDEVASQANDFEADAVAALLWLLFGSLDRQLAGELAQDGSVIPLAGTPHDPKSFWERAVGVVTPHRAQMGKVVGRFQQVFPGHDSAAIWNAVDTVERFQGQQRDVIVGSFGLGDPDLIRAEDEFLYSLNRFNVMASRARAKLIILTTRSLVDHLSDDAEVLEESRLLKNFAESFCQGPTPVTLGLRQNGVDVPRRGILRAR
jgi:DNA replication ATP-dependent helicase Dna2